MPRAIRRLNQWQAALLLTAAALALAVGPFHGSDAQEPAGPAPPTGVSATTTVTATEASATLTWNPVGNAASYGVWRSDGGVEYTTSTSYTFTDLYPHRTYNLSVWTRTADGATGPSAGVQVTMPARPGVPQTAAPTNMTLSNVTSSSVTVSWNGVAGATAYQIARSGVGRTTLAGAARNHTLTDLTAGQGYSVWLWAIGHGGISNNVRRGFNALPPAPSGLSTTATGTSLTLSWDAVTGATGYEVKQGASGSTTTVPSGTSYAFSSLTAGTEYTLHVRTKNSSGASGWSSIAAATLATGPGGLSATAANASLTLSWRAVTDATGYEVKLGAAGATVAVSSGTSHTFGNLEANTEYTLYVRTVSSDATSDWASLSATTAPAAPTIYGLSYDSDTSTGLNWRAAAGATGYEVKLGPDGAATAAGTGTQYVFRGLNIAAEYTFYVRAVNSWGASEWSKWSPCQGPYSTPTAPPPAPSGLSAPAAGADLKLSWTAARPSDTTTYEVKLNAGGAATAADTVNGHTFSGGLTAGTEYTLYVRAKNGGGASAWSSIAATTAPAAPSGARATVQRDPLCGKTYNLHVRWDGVAGATAYEVRLGADGTAITVRGTGYALDYRSYTPEELENTVYVRAKNDGGASAWISSTRHNSSRPGFGGLVCSSPGN